MKKYFTETVAKRLMLGGGLLFGLSAVLNFIVVYFFLSEDIGDCLEATCDLSGEQVTGTIAAVIGFTGIGLVAVGAILLIVLAVRRKRH